MPSGEGGNHSIYWGGRFWARGYFSTTSGNVTDDIIKQYLELHSDK
jgi:putative transposase